MGDEARCTARFADAFSEGKALLETDELVFRGDFRLVIPRGDVRSVAAEDGRLTVVFSEGTASFELGPRAERWAEKIRNPKSLLDKMGVRPGMRVSVIGLDDEPFRALLRGRGIEFSDGEAARKSDVIVLGVDTREALAGLSSVQASLVPNGAIWVVAPKGGREPREADVLAAGKEASLVDTKVVRFSDTHTAHKFVIPRGRRSPA